MDTDPQICTGVGIPNDIKGVWNTPHIEEMVRIYFEGHTNAQQAARRYLAIEYYKLHLEIYVWRRKCVEVKPTTFCHDIPEFIHTPSLSVSLYLRLPLLARSPCLQFSFSDIRCSFHFRGSPVFTFSSRNEIGIRQDGLFIPRRDPICVRSEVVTSMKQRKPYNADGLVNHLRLVEGWQRERS